MRLKELLKLNRSDEKGILNLGDRGLMRQVAAATSPGVTIEQESRRAEMKLRRRGVLLLLPILGVLAGVGNAGVAAAAPGRYKVGIKREVRVPMRDGVKLATDIYYPMENGRRLAGKLPAVLLRTPYNKSRWGPGLVRFFAEHGYLSVTQDCRGRYKSEGKFFPFRDEPEDGHDTIVWLAKHPWCNGKVGLHGPSHMAWVQFHAATQNPPGLVTMIPHHGPINAYKYSMRSGGALHLGLLRWVVQQAISSQEAQKDRAAAAGVRTMLSGKSFLQWGARIPWRRGKTPLAKFPAYEDGAFQLYFENNDYTDFWRQPGFGMDEYFDSFPKMPILWVTSWFDWYPRTISDGYQKMVKMGRKNQYVIIGPWTHNNFRHTVGDVNFGNAAGRIGSYDDFLQLELAWFNRWMKGDKRADIGERVKVFVMGGGNGKRGAGGRLNHGGRWHYGDAWPPKEIRSIPFYLRGGGVLSQEKPTQEQSSTTYSYDPRNTVSSNGRCIIAYGPAAGKGFGGMGPRDQIELEALPGHGTPGKPIADRRDVLVYQTAPLTKDLRIMGNIKVTLWVSSDAPDTDFFVKLIDRYPPGKDYPQGYSFPVSEGILRARYRDSFEKPTPMKPGHVYRLIFPLEPAANLFRAGHRIRIYICSSNFPNFDINPNTGDPNDRRPRIAKNTVYHQAAHASLIELPVDRSPNAAFTADRTNGKPPLSVNFDASASSDRGGSIANYSWDFGDGEKAEGVRASHTYNRTGYFTVTLKVSNAEGFAATTRKTISVFRQHVGKWTVKNLDPGIGGKVEPTDDGGFVIRHPGETKNVNSVVNAIFIFQQLSGDMGVQARVARKGEGRWARSGVVIRESLKPKCRLAGMFVASPGRKAGWGDPVFNFYRQLRIGDFRGYCTSGNEAPRFPDKAWVRLERRGNTLIGSWSKDGGKWTELHRVSFDPPLRERLFVGIAADISAEVRDVKLLTTAEAKPSGRNGLRRKPSHK